MSTERRERRNPKTEKEKEFCRTVETSLAFITEEFCKSIETDEGNGRGLDVRQHIKVKDANFRVELKITERKPKNHAQNVADAFFNDIMSEFEKWQKDRDQNL